MNATTEWRISVTRVDETTSEQTWSSTVRPRQSARRTLRALEKEARVLVLLSLSDERREVR